MENQGLNPTDFAQTAPAAIPSLADSAGLVDQARLAEQLGKVEPTRPRQKHAPAGGATRQLRSYRIDQASYLEVHRELIRQTTGQTSAQFGAKIGVHERVIRGMRCKQDRITPKVAAALGFEPVIIYRKIRGHADD